MTGHGPESWHPDPEFFYKTGAGPLFDMGPYYLTTLISLLGPVKRVTGSAQIVVCREAHHEPAALRHKGQRRSADARRGGA